MPNLAITVSGYASFVEIFCFKRNVESVISTKFFKKDTHTSIEMEGISLYICRLAPVVVFGRDRRWKRILEHSKEESFSGFSFLDPLNNDFGKLPNESWRREFLEIKQKLTEAGFTILDKSYLIKPLPFETDIPTILCLPDRGDYYKMYDALFYWTD
jgi:hypothetical protein